MRGRIRYIEPSGNRGKPAVKLAPVSARRRTEPIDSRLMMSRGETPRMELLHPVGLKGIDVGLPEKAMNRVHEAYPASLPSCHDWLAWTKLLHEEDEGVYGPVTPFGGPARSYLCSKCPPDSAARKKLSQLCRPIMPAELISNKPAPPAGLKITPGGEPAIEFSLYQDLHYRFVEDFPDEKETFFSDQCNGVTHDQGSWFFASNDTKFQIFKFPLSYTPHLDYHGIHFTWQETAKGTWVNGPITVTRLPKHIGDMGYDHLGDIDHFKGRLFIPLEHHDMSKPGRIAVYDAKDLSFIGASVLDPQVTDLGWCAFNPQDGLLYTSDFTGYGSPGPLVVHGYEWIQYGAHSHFKKVVSYEVIPIGGKLPHHRIQGGAFMKNGLLHISCDDFKNPSKCGHISVIQIPSSPSAVALEIYRFYLNYSPGSILGGNPYTEVQGLTLWDLDAEGYALGQLHVVLIENDFYLPFVSPDVTIKHIRIPASQRVFL